MVSGKSVSTSIRVGAVMQKSVGAAIADTSPKKEVNTYRRAIFFGIEIMLDTRY